MDIPLNKAFIDDEELAAIAEVLRSRRVGGDGPVTRQVELDMARRFGAGDVLLTSSCTHALELALMVLDVGPGDEVICPSFTFTSTANAVVRQRARPVFADIEAVTLGLDPDDVAPLITPRTRAIVVVHYGGVACDMNRIDEIAARHGLVVIEDAAHGVGARYHGRYLGTLGDIGCYSFHETKNLTCGEGGAFLTRRREYARAAEIIREKGTDRAAFVRGEVDKYTWRGVGSSFVLSDVLAAMLAVQLRKLDEISRRRLAIYERYLAGLRALEKAGDLLLPTVPPACETNAHVFHVRFQDESTRDRCQRALRAAGIQAAFHFVPLHSAPYGRQLAGEIGRPLPVTDLVSRTMLRLPLFPELRDDEVDLVISRMRDFFGTDGGS